MSINNKINNPKTIKIIVGILIIIGIITSLILINYKNKDSLIARIGTYDESLNKITTTKIIKDPITVYDVIKIYLESESINLTDDKLKKPNYNLVIDMPKDGVGFITSDIWLDKDSIIIRLDNKGQYKILSKENDLYFRKILNK